jgi:protoporphyrinogen oxidase
MTKNKHRTKTQTRVTQLKKQISQSKTHLQELDSERQKTINDILILTGRILELKEILKDKKQEPPV